jgi:hypothetical protein
VPPRWIHSGEIESILGTGWARAAVKNAKSSKVVSQAVACERRDAE